MKMIAGALMNPKGNGCPATSSLASSEPEDTFTEFDCELLSQFFELDADQLF
jgi:hypothetical protein